MFTSIFGSHKFNQIYHGCQPEKPFDSGMGPKANSENLTLIRQSEELTFIKAPVTAAHGHPYPIPVKG